MHTGGKLPTKNEIYEKPKILSACSCVSAGWSVPRLMKEIVLLATFP